MSRPRPSGRSYGRLTRHERNAIERMLDRNRSAREIAAELGRSPSTVTREVAAHRYVTAPRSRYGEPAPEDLSGACPRLAAWPRCCNGCSHRRGYGCSRRPRVFYSARRAQEAADAELSSSRSGIDETEEGAAAKLAAIRGGLARGLSPQQIAATTPGLHSLSTCGNEATARCRELVPRCASCGNAGSVQAVALRLKINQKRRSCDRL